MPRSRVPVAFFGSCSRIMASVSRRLACTSYRMAESAASRGTQNLRSRCRLVYRAERISANRTRSVDAPKRTDTVVPVRAPTERPRRKEREFDAPPASSSPRFRPCRSHGGDRAGRRARRGGGDEGRHGGQDHPQRPGDPDDRGRHLQGARLRLRLRVRRGQHLRDRRHLPDLATPSARSGSAPTPRRPEGFTNLDSDLFYQRIKDRGIVEELVQRAGPPRARSPRSSRWSRATSPATTPTWSKTGVRRDPRPDVRRPAVGAADHEDGRLPALLRARPCTRAGASRSTGSPTRSRRRASPRPPRADAAAARRGHAGRGASVAGARRGARLHRLGLERLGHRQRGDRAPAAAWCSPTRTSPGRGRGASISRTW